MREGDGEGRGKGDEADNEFQFDCEIVYLYSIILCRKLLDVVRMVS